MRDARRDGMKRLLAVFPLILAAACGGAATSLPAGGDAGTDGTPAETSSPAPSTCSDCLSVEIAWAYDGGLSAYTSSSSLSACRQFTYARSDVTQRCSVDLGACADPPISVADVERALADPDVVAALAGTTQLYGSDPRGCDGAVLDVTVGSRTVEVGGDCANANSCGPATAPCVPVPPGLAALADLLSRLQTQELATPTCKAIFP